MILAFLGTAYQVILAGALKSGTLVTMEPASPEGLLAGIYTLLSAIGLLILIACIVQYATPEKKVLGVLGLSFTSLFTAVVCINRFAQLTIIRQSLLIADTSGLDRYAVWLPFSIFRPGNVGVGGISEPDSLLGFSPPPSWKVGALDLGTIYRLRSSRFNLCPGLCVE